MVDGGQMLFLAPAMSECQDVFCANRVNIHVVICVRLGSLSRLLVIAHQHLQSTIMAMLMAFALDFTF